MQTSLLFYELACARMSHTKTLTHRFQNNGLSNRMNPGYEQRHVLLFCPITLFSTFIYSLGFRYLND
ncbi:protein of unknown function [Cupriavidus taiwanensis]|uniref:Uncharacterized protein n=1 Tax=Cupriavidus taiwanensis TaxID=164546 RepID=A0A9Q7XQ23_9BURK|nr:protein of unknown function [Cupriavidus taiwanensis]